MRTSRVIRWEGEPAHGTVLSLSQEDAGWQYVSFRVWRLEAGETVQDRTGDEEVGLVVLSGRVSVMSSRGDWKGIGDRANVFDGKPYAVYLPPQSEFEVTADSRAEVARAGARATKGVDAYLIRPDEIVEESRGQGNAQRTIRHLLEADRPAEHLFLVEALTPSGNWSSYPPHKHDVDDYPRETYLEETYFHRIRPPQGFGFQRVYTPGGSEAPVVIEDGVLVTVPAGYHPAVVAPGYELYYLNVMAGPVREWRFTDDPSHAWVAKTWTQYGPKAAR